MLTIQELWKFTVYFEIGLLQEKGSHWLSKLPDYSYNEFQTIAPSVAFDYTATGILALLAP